ncbi:winged helix-turn-helix transcriptional regulator [Actinomadura chibensis]|uniref:Winged helix-turn-helix transcriptional regulator n=1 Tax=Actinomadura chibensis TaxID=392828 RepID=A0A5D0NCW1_9ACTN|nr:winged helix-turn-helix transcriptional regulator [Actinomadura chibensis]
MSLVHAFDVLGDPVRRRILELLAEGERSAGDVSGVIRAEFGISQPAVSQHLRVLRDAGFAVVRADGARRLYAVDAAPLQEIDAWLDRFRRFWTPHLDALATEIARGKRARREQDDDKQHDDKQPDDKQHDAPGSEL